MLDILEETPAVEEVTGRSDNGFTGAAAEHVSFSYGEEVILDDVSAEIPQNQIVGIVKAAAAAENPHC